MPKWALKDRQTGHWLGQREREPREPGILCLKDEARRGACQQLVVSTKPTPGTHQIAFKTMPGTHGIAVKAMPGTQQIAVTLSCPATWLAHPLGSSSLAEIEVLTICHG